MKCTNCGTELREGAKFCPSCGASVGQEAPGTPGAPRMETPAPRKHRGKGLVIGVAVAAVAVIAAAGVGLSGLLASPGDKVAGALAKTVAAYAECAGKTGLPDLSELSAKKSMTQRMSLELASVNQELVGYDLSALKGLGFRTQTDMDMSQRKLATEMTAYWGEEELVSFRLSAQENMLYGTSPQFTAGKSLAVNTEAMGDDLADLTGEDELKGMNFNLFDIMDTVYAYYDRQPEMEAAMDEANRQLLTAMEVTKGGSETISVNGKSTKADAYELVLTQESLEDWADAMVDAMETMDVFGMWEDLLKEMGMPRDQVDMMMEQLGGDPFRQLSQGIDQVLDAVGDVELTVYLSGGYLAQVVYDDHGVEVTLSLGGGSQYVDDLTLEIAAEGDEVLLESSGDHGGKSGVFTDETVLRVRSGGETTLRLTSEYSYEPKGEGNNFFWEIAVDELGSLSMEGRLEGGKDSLLLDLEDLSVKAMGMELAALEAEYYVGPCEGVQVDSDGAVMVLEMSDSELYDLADDIQSDAEDWAYDMEELVYDRLPSELVWALMYGFYF